MEDQKEVACDLSNNDICSKYLNDVTGHQGQYLGKYSIISPTKLITTIA